VLLVQLYVLDITIVLRLAGWLAKRDRGYTHARQGVSELQKANRYAASSRKKMCCLMWVLLIVVLVVLGPVLADAAV
jgi:hypothetical protein